VSEPAVPPPAVPPPAAPQPAAPASARHDATHWFSQRRVKIALVIALLEGLIVAIEDDFSRWTVIIIAAPIIAFYLLAGRSLDSRLGREISWILAASQAFAVILVILAVVLKAFVWIAVAGLAVLALFLILSDRPARKAS
jgi:hypothetical protein